MTSRSVALTHSPFQSHTDGSACATHAHGHDQQFRISISSALLKVSRRTGRVSNEMSAEQPGLEPNEISVSGAVYGVVRGHQKSNGVPTHSPCCPTTAAAKPLPPKMPSDGAVAAPNAAPPPAPIPVPMSVLRRRRLVHQLHSAHVGLLNASFSGAFLESNCRVRHRKKVPECFFEFVSII